MKNKFKAALDSLKKEQSQRKTREEMGVSLGQKEKLEDHQNLFQQLVTDFYAAQSLEEKEAILGQIYELRGDVPMELEMVVNEMKSGKSR